MKGFLTTAMLAAAALAAPAQAAPTITFSPGSPVPLPGTAVIQNFDGIAPGTSIGTGANVFADSVSGVAARPAFGSTGNFAAVQGPNGSYTINFGPANLFAFTLGSLDTYNSLTLLFSDSTSITYQGGQIINGLSFPSGNQISGESNGQVRFTALSGDPRIVGATFSSTQNSFEFDNIAIGAVPEPVTWAMMIAGFGLIGSTLRRRRATGSFAIA